MDTPRSSTTASKQLAPIPSLHCPAVFSASASRSAGASGARPGEYGHHPQRPAPGVEREPHLPALEFEVGERAGVVLRARRPAGVQPVERAQPLGVGDRRLGGVVGDDDRAGDGDGDHRFALTAGERVGTYPARAAVQGPLPGDRLRASPGGV
jgi:hypothetical protein